MTEMKLIETAGQLLLALGLIKVILSAFFDLISQTVEEVGRIKEKIKRWR